jgi:phosphoribosylamine--glycine ligase
LKIFKQKYTLKPKNDGGCLMKIAVVGGGGREHALAFKIEQSSLCDKLYCLPGNAGTSKIAENIEIAADDIESIVKFAKNNNIDLVVVGPEDPLSKGIVDALNSENIKAFGPNKKAAQIEASKSFAKYIFKKYNIPTADFETFDNYEMAVEYVKKIGAPIVVKADGLAAGKGVTVAQTEDEAINALKDIFLDNRFGEAGNSVVIEECLFGEEASFLVFSDGKDILPMIAAQDHKPVFDNDKGPNTGGMGVYAKAPIVDKNLEKEIIENFMKKAIEGLKKEGIEYKGVLYAGLMIDKNRQPKILEFNCRFGDPETQAILPLMDSDIVEIFLASIEGHLSSKTIKWKDAYAVSVVAASGGYPGQYEKGKVIEGLNEVEKLDDVFVFHAGTKLCNDKVVTNGGRVLNVVGVDKDFKKAQEKAYNAIKMIHFDGMQYRSDIGNKAYKYL